MGLIINGTPPTSIPLTKEGTTKDLNILKVKKNNVIENFWGRPFTLTIENAEHSTIIVERLLSPNQNAELGALSDGSLIYYGDQIQINITVEDGYALTQLVLSTYSSSMGWIGSEIENGYIADVDQSLKVSSYVEQSASWKTIFTGQKNVLSSKTDANSYTTTPLDIDKVVSDGDIKVTGYVHYYASGVTETTENFTDVEVKNDGTTILVSDIANISTSSNLIQVRAKSTKLLTSVKQTRVSITEVKQYY